MNQNETPYSDHQAVLASFGERYDPGPEDHNFVSTLARGLDVIRAFQAKSGALSNTDISRITGIPKPTVTRLTYTLCRLGYMEQEKKGRRYRLAAGLLALAYPVLSGERIRLLAYDRMAEIARDTECNLALSVPDHERRKMIYLDGFNGINSNFLHIDIGMRLDIGKTATGRAYLSAVSLAEREDYFTRLDATGSAEKANLVHRIKSSIAEIEERGFCLVDGEWIKETRAVAVPVKSEGLGSIYVISCGAPVYAISNEKLVNELGPKLVHMVKDILNILPRSGTF